LAPVTGPFKSWTKKKIVFEKKSGPETNKFERGYPEDSAQVITLKNVIERGRSAEEKVE